jgi:sporulation protein YlmC with PRC-barrel domain
MSERIDIAVGVLDHQLIDSDGWRCGKVDDVELEGIQEGNPAVAAILVGPRAWRGRGVIGRIAARLARSPRQVRIEWSDVHKVEAAVTVRRSAEELSLNRGEVPARRLIGWIPGANR